MPRCLTNTKFIEKAKAVHGDRYDYSLVEYKKNSINVIIICKEHGEFRQLPNNHIKGSGCRKCSSIHTTEEFIAKARLTHKDTYDYFCSVYEGALKKIAISCSTHGIFNQIPSIHIFGQGCPKCFGTNILTTEEFKHRSNIVHNQKYDYSKSEYVRSYLKIDIICKEHGIFQQSPSSHMLGRGCPKCSRTGFDTSKPSKFYIYSISSFIGYGISNIFVKRNSEHRTVFTKLGVSFKLLYTFDFDSGMDCLTLEKLIKSTLPLSKLSKNIEGFKTESTSYENLNLMLAIIKEFMYNVNITKETISEFKTKVLPLS